MERISESGGTGFDACCGVDHADLCCYNVNYQLQTRLVSYKGREERSAVERKGLRPQKRMVVASSADSASFSKTRLYVSCSTCDFFSKWTRNRACASLDELAVGNSDGEVGSVGGGTFGE